MDKEQPTALRAATSKARMRKLKLHKTYESYEVGHKKPHFIGFIKVLLPSMLVITYQSHRLYIQL